MNTSTAQDVNGQFVTLNGERFYKIEHVDQMPAFFICLVSDSDHWLFASSTGGLTAGRVSPETALFPYVTVDKIHESTPHTGCKTLLRVVRNGDSEVWQPFNYHLQQNYHLQRNLFKNTLGNKLCFEEVNFSLNLVFRYTWTTSQEYGFCRQVDLVNLADAEAKVEILDGFINLLPAGTPRFTQAQSSNLVDAYKFNELDQQSGVALYSLYSGITDRAEPCESLRATSVFCLGLEAKAILLSEHQLPAFSHQQDLHGESSCRGVRGAYLINADITLAARDVKQWQLVANLEQSQAEVVDLIEQLRQPATLCTALFASIEQGSDRLARIMASSDGFQITGEEEVAVHHYANTLFNVLRGGIFNDQYFVSGKDFRDTIALFNRAVFSRHQDFLQKLPARISIQQLHSKVDQQSDEQLSRLTLEYLPITFGRRHGDPSRPWNQFAINLRDKQGNPLLSYQGNWRDIFQNWEALTFSYPEFIESVIAKFVNASTMDGYNPYRITKQGIDWEVEEPDDPWSYIGYWGDHQIIYLLKMLELSQQFNPQKLSELLFQPLFSYANVPYRIKDFDALLVDAKSTVSYDQELADLIEQRVEQIGSDGKLVLDNNGQVYQVNLMEKLLVPLLAKLSNLVVDGGIWLNTQRPEWNDANNALVGQGLSMVTLYYMRRYVCFMQQLLAAQSQSFDLSLQVGHWLTETADVLAEAVNTLPDKAISDDLRFDILESLGQAGARYRAAVYKNACFSGKIQQSIEPVRSLLRDALTIIDRSILFNRGTDGLYHAYNLLAVTKNSASIDHLYPMLEGQVAALSSGAIKGDAAVEVLDALFNSAVFRPDQQTFMLYPDRLQTPFLDKNIVPAEQVKQIPLLLTMLEQRDNSIILRDKNGNYRFNPDLKNIGDLRSGLKQLPEDYASQLLDTQQAIEKLYEQVFNHQAFTGRSGGMFGFEGLGSIYWHMVSKLLLAVKEQFFISVKEQHGSQTIQRLGALYYRIRQGIGFNKTPQQYGAFPTDPYSHTPKHAGAQQPGMTGQVKEEVLSRFAELGILVENGQVHFLPLLLRQQEFLTQANPFTYLDVHQNWQTLSLSANSLAFSWCQIPFVYQLSEQSDLALSCDLHDGTQQTLSGQDGSALVLSAEHSQDIFNRNGNITRVTLSVPVSMLFKS